MRAGLSLAWSISLTPDETFVIEGQAYLGAPVVKIVADLIVADLLEPSSGGLDVMLSGFAYKQNGELGQQRRRVRVRLDDVRIPAEVRNEHARIHHYATRFVSKVKS